MLLFSECFGVLSDMHFFVLVFIEGDCSDIMQRIQTLSILISLFYRLCSTYLRLLLTTTRSLDFVCVNDSSHELFGQVPIAYAVQIRIANHPDTFTLWTFFENAASCKKLGGVTLPSSVIDLLLTGHDFLTLSPIYTGWKWSWYNSTYSSTYWMFDWSYSQWIVVRIHVGSSSWVYGLSFIAQLFFINSFTWDQSQFTSTSSWRKQWTCFRTWETLKLPWRL